VLFDVGGGFFFSASANFADDYSGISSFVLFKEFESIHKGHPHNGITA